MGQSIGNETVNFKAMLKYKTISKKDLQLFRFADTPEEAFEYLRDELTKLYRHNNTKTLFRTLS